MGVFDTAKIKVDVEVAGARPAVESAIRVAGRRAAERYGGLRGGPVAQARGGPFEAAGGGLAVLHSAAVHPTWGRWTIVCARPADLLEVRDTGGADPFDLLAQQGCRWRCYRTADIDLPFWGGWIGYLAYEAGRFIEDLPASAANDVRLPVARFGLYGSAAIYDHEARRWFVVGVELPEAADGALVGADGVAFWQSVLAEAEHVDPGADQAGAIRPAAIDQVDAFLGAMRPSLDERAFQAAVARAVEYIAAGDVYQVNLARRLTTALPADPLEVYLRLCRTNPAWYAAYLGFDDKAVLSSSPELFLELRGRQVVTRPIKGTRPRVGDAEADRRAAVELLASPKDLAELTMIVDLERNDLGRVCEFGSVRVREPFGLEEHPTVYHLVGTIEGRLAAGHGAVDLLRATFPGGSITGAPKIRAMQIVDELEPVVRSVYCGGVGCLSLDGHIMMNVAIRTLIVDGQQVHVYVGGGIVADSQPEMELAETTAKARGMVRALMNW